MGAGGGGVVLRRAATGLALATLWAGCSLFHREAPTPPEAPEVVAPGATLVGVASWYGPGFNGHRTASGEIYNQEDMTAASNSFPLGTRLMVTNLENQRSAAVRVNDRGPFRKQRKLDLSHAAARVLGITQPGTARVEMEVLSAPASAGEVIAGRLRYFVQLGAFSESRNARELYDRLAPRYADVRIDTLAAGKHRYYRVRMGAFSSRQEAQARATESASLGLPMLIVAE
ncbi:MAG: septal ring lytic transglycosylase RlpA family protein [Candidatus Binataceae bacterium]